MDEDTPSVVSSEAPVGATITTAYAGRNVRVFAVLESELHTLTFFNLLSTVFFSIGASLASIAIGVWVSASFTGKLTPEGAVLKAFGAPVLVVLAVVSFGIGIWAMHSKKSSLTTIREQSSTKTD